MQQQIQPCTGIYGLGSTFDNAEVTLIPVPWDACSSYRRGAAEAPACIMEASPQLDLFHPDYPTLPEQGIYCLPLCNEQITRNTQASAAAKQIIAAFDQGVSFAEDRVLESLQAQVNTASDACNAAVYQAAERCIQANKLIGVMGGNHSSSHGLIKALIDYVDSFTVLQLDAHMDLRPAYQGLTYSHASVMHNILQENDVCRLIQVGVRDFCKEEYQVMKASKGRIKTYFNQDIKAHFYAGKSWDSLCKKIINNCSNTVYVSLDVDVLSPQYCPHTGTPVPGGLDVDHVVYLIKQLQQSKRTIIGFDVVEAAGPTHSVDIITAARLLYMLAGYGVLTHGE